MRQCPNCRISLEEIGREGEILDRCPKCLGMFFDQGELERMVELMRCHQAVRLDEMEVPSVPEAEIRRVVHCPADGEAMEPVDAGKLVFDTCPRCGGIWLDNGELAALKATETHIRQHINLYIRLGH